MFFSRVAPIIKNQSMIVQIPNPPQVNNFPIPKPVSPIKKRSIPNVPPPTIEIINAVVGSFSC